MKAWAIVTVAVLLSGVAHGAAHRRQRTANDEEGVAREAESYQLPPTGTLSRGDLTKFALKEYGYRRRDKFDAPFDDRPLLGRQFRIDLPVEERPSVLGPSWDYDVEKSDLSLDEPIASWTYDEFLIATAHSEELTSFPERIGLPQGLFIWRYTTHLGTVLESNAYGASVAVRRINTDSVAVGPFSFGGSEGILGEQKAFHAEKTLAPEQARAAVKGLFLRIEGSVVPTRDGKSLYCGGEVSDATFDDPVEGGGTNCVISAKITRVSFISPAAGVLATWAGAPRPAIKGD